MKRTVVVLAVLALVWGLTAPAGAAQLSADDDPTVEGPLNATPEDCEGLVDRTEGGVIRARLKVCGFSFALDPASENDADRNYGVFWVQAHVAPRNDFCVKTVRTTIRFDRDVPRHSRSPAEREVDERRRVRVRIEADAQGQVDEGSEGIVRNSFVMYPGSLTRNSILHEGAGERSLRWKWRGRTGRKVALASGVEISWPSTSVLAPTFRYSLFVKLGGQDC